MIEQGAARWQVVYRRDNSPTSQTFREVVVAGSTDEARAAVKLIDPHFSATVRSPRKMQVKP